MTPEFSLLKYIKIDRRGTLKRVVWYFEESDVYFEEGDVVLRRGWYGTFKRLRW